MITSLLASAVPMSGLFAALPVAAVNWHSVLFLLFAAVACACAVAVVLADNVVRMAFYLVLSLAATAGLFFLAGAEFVGAMQLMIYVGGMVGAALLAVLLQAAFRVEPWRRPAMAAVAAPAATPIGMALLGVRVDEPVAGAPLAAVRSGYLLPFEIVSVHLLVVLVGAAYLARAKRRRTPRAIDVAASSVGPVVTAREAARSSASALASGGQR